MTKETLEKAKSIADRISYLQHSKKRLGFAFSAIADMNRGSETSFVCVSLSSYTRSSETQTLDLDLASLAKMLGYEFDSEHGAVECFLQFYVKVVDEEITSLEKQLEEL